MKLETCFRYVLFLSHFTFSLQNHHNYAVKTSLSKSDLQKVIGSSGVVLGGLECPRDSNDIKDCSSRIYHVKLDMWLDIPEEGYHPGRSKRSASHPLESHPEVHHLQHQPELPVSKRLDSSLAAMQQLLLVHDETHLPDDDKYDEAYKSYADKIIKLVGFDDPKANSTWQYLARGNQKEKVGLDINVFPAYLAGLTGKGSTVVVLDDGIDHENVDLKNNYAPEVSTNVADATEHNTDPRGPYRRMRIQDGHGTRCAGLIAASADNKYCSHGVAYNAYIGAVRMLVGSVTDILEATALSYNTKDVDIYTASWGPTDDGRTMDRPRQHARTALKNAREQGRHGLGSLILFACGNGGAYGDVCGADGFVSSPYVIAIAALAKDGSKSVYSEACPGIRTSVPIGNLGKLTGDQLPTTSENGGCVDTFVGTSAAAPLAGGCLALVLEANPKLGVRDVENIISWSSRMPNGNKTNWIVNAGGLLCSVHAGFGLLDCYRATQLARSWKNVGPSCILKESEGELKEGSWASKQSTVPKSPNYRKLWSKSDVESFTRELNDVEGWPILHNNRTKIPIEVEETMGEYSPEANELAVCKLDIVEKVVVQLQWKHICRGALSFALRSPSGSQVVLLGKRKRDTYAGEGDMSITAVSFLGEPVQGTWVLEARSSNNCRNETVQQHGEELRGKVIYVGLEFHGTASAHSGYQVNQPLLRPLLTTVGRRALSRERGHRLSHTQARTAFNEQRWRALKNSEDNLPQKPTEEKTTLS